MAFLRRGQSNAYLQCVTMVSAITVLMAAGGGLTKDLVDGGKAILSCRLEEGIAEAEEDVEAVDSPVIIVGTTMVSAAVKPPIIWGISAGKTSMTLCKKYFCIFNIGN